MTYFVEKLTISPDASWHSGAKEVCETQQGGPVPNAQEESSVKADAFFLAACKPFSGRGVQLPPPYLGSLMPFPAVDISAVKAHRAKSPLVWQECSCLPLDQCFLAPWL